jgi:hypothetical protein
MLSDDAGVSGWHFTVYVVLIAVVGYLEQVTHCLDTG